MEEDRLRLLRLPKVPQMLVEPLTDEEIATVLSAVDRSTSAGARGYTVLVLLLNTGLRASELAGLRFEDLQLDQGYLRVRGKGNKERIVPLGNNAKKELLHHIYRIRPETERRPEEAVFLSSAGQPLTTNALKLFFSRLRGRTGIRKLHAHTCRHTFAVKYLINGGDIISLQWILGHSDLSTVRIYLNLTQAQVAAQHSRYSPMDNIRLPRPLRRGKRTRSQ